MPKQGKEVVKVTQDKEKPVERNVLAAAIVDISRAMNKLVSSGLTREAIIVLVHDRCPSSFRNPKPSKSTIRAVFNALSDLEHEFCRK